MLPRRLYRAAQPRGGRMRTCMGLSPPDLAGALQSGSGRGDSAANVEEETTTARRTWRVRCSEENEARAWTYARGARCGLAASDTSSDLTRRPQRRRSEPTRRRACGTLASGLAASDAAPDLTPRLQRTVDERGGPRADDRARGALACRLAASDAAPDAAPRPQSRIASRADAHAKRRRARRTLVSG